MFIWKLLVTLLTTILRSLLLVFEKYFEIFANEFDIEDDHSDSSKKQWVMYSRLCDKKLTGYVLDEKISTQTFSNQMDDCGLPFYAQKVNNFSFICCYVISLDFDTKSFDRSLTLIFFLSS